jgi:hypothetical protein
MSKRREQPYYREVYGCLEEQPNSGDHNGVPSLFLSDEDYFDEYDEIYQFSNTSKAEDIKNMVTGAAGAAGTALSAGVVIWPLTKIAEMGITAVYITAKVSFAGKRGLQDSAEFIKNSVNWMLGNKDAFNNIAQMNKVENSIKTEMTKIGDLYNNSKDKNFKDKYLKYMTDYDAASNKDFSPSDKLKLQKEFLASLNKDIGVDFHQENKSTINGILENIKKYEKLNYAAEERYRRSGTNKALSNMLETVKETVNKPLKKAKGMTIELTNISTQAAGKLTSPRKTLPIRSRSDSIEF